MWCSQLTAFHGHKVKDYFDKICVPSHVNIIESFGL